MRHNVPSCAAPTAIGDKSASAAAACLASALKYLVIGAIGGASLISGAEVVRRGSLPEPPASISVR
jgi:hypothetical protein